MYRLEFDGLFRNAHEDEAQSSAGLMCYGWQILRGKKVIAHGHGTFTRGRDANSNLAEYLALIEGLDALHDMGVKHEKVVICGDAKSVIHQMQGIAGVSSPTVKTLYARARLIAKKFNNLQWVWLPRRHNRAADALSRHALRHLSSNRQKYADILRSVQEAAKSRLASRLVDIGGLRVYQPIRG